MRPPQDHEQKFYYGRGCSAPQLEGAMAIHTWTVGHSTCIIELNAGISRGDIGRVSWLDKRPGSSQEWVTVFDEKTMERLSITYDDPRFTPKDSV